MPVRAICIPAHACATKIRDISFHPASPRPEETDASFPYCCDHVHIFGNEKFPDRGGHPLNLPFDLRSENGSFNETKEMLLELRVLKIHR